MIQSISINGLRGIAKGEIKELAPLTVLVGPNSSGKSTILDALFIAVSDDQGYAIHYCVSGRRNVRRPARWLLNQNVKSDGCEISVNSGIGLPIRTCKLTHSSFEKSDKIVCSTDITDLPYELIAELDFVEDKSVKFRTRSAISKEVREQVSHRQLEILKEDKPDPEALRNSSRLWPISIVDGRVAPKGLDELYSASVTLGRSKYIAAIVSSALGRQADLRSLTENGKPILHCVYEDFSLPVGVQGEAIETLLRLALELAACAQGIVMLEEPEVHQHPRVIRESARVILEAVKRDIQVIITTHSLELIDALLGEAKDRGMLDQLAVFRTNLTEGQLATSRISGADAAFSRQQIEDDLR